MARALTFGATRRGGFRLVVLGKRQEFPRACQVVACSRDLAFRRIARLEPGQTLIRVQDEARFAHFAVINDVKPMIDLLADDVRDGSG